MTQATDDGTTSTKIVRLKPRFRPRPRVAIDAAHWAALLAACRALEAIDRDGVSD